MTSSYIRAIVVFVCLFIYPLCFPDAFRGIINSLPYSVTNTILIITIIISLYHKLQVTICNFIFNLVLRRGNLPERVCILWFMGMGTVLKMFLTARAVTSANRKPLRTWWVIINYTFTSSSCDFLFTKCSDKSLLYILCHIAWNTDCMCVIK